jgi:ketosteroid isomerase-like protein
MPTPNDELIQRFYAAFAARDGAAMAACYTPDATFSDPVFPGLRGPEVGAMWTMLTERGKDLQIQLAEHEANGDAGSALWIANYTFAQTGRPVENRIQASFQFRDGLIADHRDEFSFWRWSRQAMGPAGAALGWTPILLAAVRRRARAQLDEYMKSGTPN